MAVSPNEPQRPGPPPTSRLIRLRYPGACESCSIALAAGENAWWSRSRKAARCDGCGPEPATAQPAEPSSGEAGGSAQREYERRSEAREQRIREAHPRIGRLILALSSAPHTTAAWERGAEGERRLGAILDAAADEVGARVLHDRRRPGTRANIDHLVVAQAGVFVIDAKRYRGKVAQRDVGGLRRRDLRLYVGGRDCTKLVEDMALQVATVRTALAGVADAIAPPVFPVVCFVEAEWGLLSRPMGFGDVWVMWPRALRRLLDQPGSLEPEDVTALASVLATALPGA